MSSVLLLKSSILGEYSQSNKLVDLFKHAFSELNAELIERDLAVSPIPMLDGELVQGFGGVDAPTQRQQQALALSDELIAEIQQSDTLVMAAPMYNFMIPAQLKSWIDFISRAGVTFRYTEQGPVGALTGKRVIVVTTRGGKHQGTATDQITPYLQTVLGFLGMTEVEFVYAEALNMGSEAANENLDSAQQQIQRLLASATVR
ncbi:FMN-dependent NADH-azoreductase [Shewanella gelidii]|uniref:FMN dependent NADH:quinone oxidoreductase n=1 Tax=Shewanella gelidii TaxID=1642821 RepID=A0A917JUX6_9GAMM|nr:FMN-dependent NADH-azoreductase [Shewanella gelidii]MCL1098441.1 FMN-dependent NADH-azoreductase [Shewanella gelidii]GGI82716.1 FMN-dependent NADH-azoreductase [Shewanella gelidii]